VKRRLGLAMCAAMSPPYRKFCRVVPTSRHLAACIAGLLQAGIPWRDIATFPAWISTATSF
jgi:hypothetical protein